MAAGGWQRSLSASEDKSWRFEQKRFNLGRDEACGRSAGDLAQRSGILLERVRPSLSEQDYRKLKAVVEGLSYLTELIADKDATIRDLRGLLFPLVTEKGGAGAGRHEREARGSR